MKVRDKFLGPFLHLVRTFRTLMLYFCSVNQKNNNYGHKKHSYIVHQTRDF